MTEEERLDRERDREAQLEWLGVINKTKFYLHSEIKCIAGGCHNMRKFNSYEINHLDKKSIYVD